MRRNASSASSKSAPRLNDKFNFDTKPVDPFQTETLMLWISAASAPNFIQKQIRYNFKNFVKKQTQIRYAELEVVPHPLEARRDQRHVLEDEAPHQIIGHCPIPHTKIQIVSHWNQQIEWINPKKFDKCWTVHWPQIGACPNEWNAMKRSFSGGTFAKSSWWAWAVRAGNHGTADWRVCRWHSDLIFDRRSGPLNRAVSPPRTSSWAAQIRAQSVASIQLPPSIRASVPPEIDSPGRSS